MCELRLFLGTMQRHPESWIIIGSFYPRRERFAAGKERQGLLLEMDDLDAYVRPETIR
jgi:hypothetical protein